MKQRSKWEALFFAIILIVFGVQGILQGTVPAFEGRNHEIPSTSFQSPLVPWIGLLLILAGSYVIVRFFVRRKK